MEHTRPHLYDSIYVVQASHVTITKDASSGVAAITVNDQGVSVCYLECCLICDQLLIVGENSIVIVSGANNKLSPADVEKAESLISSAAVVVCQLEVPPETSLAALALAKKHEGIKTLLTLVNLSQL